MDNKIKEELKKELKETGKLLLILVKNIFVIAGMLMVIYYMVKGLMTK